MLVTAGGTREPIDSVRYVGNRSSGRMGLALAEEAARRGADVTLVARERVASAARRASAACDVETTAELEAAVRERFERTDVLLMAAAPADFRPARARRREDLEGGRDGLALELEPTDATSLAAVAAAGAPGQTLIGFAAEHGEGAVERGRDKLERKGLDAVVVNDISRPDIGFDSDRQRGHDRDRRRRARGRRAARRRRSRPPSSTRSSGSRTQARRRPSYPRTRAMSGENATTSSRRAASFSSSGDFMAAAVPLERARELEPDKGSIREALGRAYFRSRPLRQGRARSSPRWSSATR